MSDVLDLPASKLASQCGITARTAQTILNTLKSDAVERAPIQNSQLPDTFKAAHTVDVDAFQTRTQTLTRTSHYAAGLTARRAPDAAPAVFDETLLPTTAATIGAAVRAGAQAEHGDGPCTALQLLETVQAREGAEAAGEWSAGSGGAGGEYEAGESSTSLVTLSQALDALLRGVREISLPYLRVSMIDSGVICLVVSMEHMIR